ncbi:hypothetical protein B0H11DRAFT_1935255 [Mycena galericulata]|nr:hypothetical protein B0H11DRAFT_1935255 [Mycena galericulata]
MTRDTRHATPPRHTRTLTQHLLSKGRAPPDRYTEFMWAERHTEDKGTSRKRRRRRRMWRKGRFVSPGPRLRALSGLLSPSTHDTRPGTWDPRAGVICQMGRGRNNVKEGGKEKEHRVASSVRRTRDARHEMRHTTRHPTPRPRRATRHPATPLALPSSPPRSTTYSTPPRYLCADGTTATATGNARAEHGAADGEDARPERDDTRDEVRRGGRGRGRAWARRAEQAAVASKTAGRMGRYRTEMSAALHSKNGEDYVARAGPQTRVRREHLGAQLARGCRMLQREGGGGAAGREGARKSEGGDEQRRGVHLRWRRRRAMRLRCKIDAMDHAETWLRRSMSCVCAIWLGSTKGERFRRAPLVRRTGRRLGIEWNQISRVGSGASAAWAVQR